MREICSIINGPVSVSVVADNVVIKLPLTHEGLISCKKFWTEYKIPVNITLCFSPGQALLAAKAGACFISPFVARLDDISYDGLSLIKGICTIYSNYGCCCIIEAARLGADSITVPAKVLRQLIDHQGLAIFEKDWGAK